MNNEPETHDLFAQRLREAGFTVYCQVSCRERGNYTGRDLRLDVMALAPPPWTERYGFRTVGIEIKGHTTFGKSYIEPIFQADAYMAAYCFTKDKILLPRPEIVAIARREWIEVEANEKPADWVPLDLVSERFAWKLGTALVERMDGEIGFKTNIGGTGSERWVPLFKTQGQKKTVRVGTRSGS